MVRRLEAIIRLQDDLVAGRIAALDQRVNGPDGMRQRQTGTEEMHHEVHVRNIVFLCNSGALLWQKCRQLM